MNNLIKYWYLEIEFIDGVHRMEVKKYVGLKAGSYAAKHRRYNNYYSKRMYAERAMYAIRYAMRGIMTGVVDEKA